MSVATYKAHKDGLLFSNGNYYPKVRTRTGWRYNFCAGNIIERDTAQETAAVQTQKSNVDQRNWLTF